MWLGVGARSVSGLVEGRWRRRPRGARLSCLRRSARDVPRDCVELWRRSTRAAGAVLTVVVGCEPGWLRVRERRRLGGVRRSGVGAASRGTFVPELAWSSALRSLHLFVFGGGLEVGRSSGRLPWASLAGSRGWPAARGLYSGSRGWRWVDRTGLRSRCVGWRPNFGRLRVGGRSRESWDVVRRKRAPGSCSVFCPGRELVLRREAPGGSHLVAAAPCPSVPGRLSAALVPRQASGSAVGGEGEEGASLRAQPVVVRVAWGRLAQCGCFTWNGGSRTRRQALWRSVFHVKRSTECCPRLEGGAGPSRVRNQRPEHSPRWTGAYLLLRATGPSPRHCGTDLRWPCSTWNTARAPHSPRRS